MLRAEDLASSSCNTCRRQRKKCSRELVRGCERCRQAGLRCEYVATRRSRHPEIWVDSTGRLRAQQTKLDVVEFRLSPAAEEGGPPLAAVAEELRGVSEDLIPPFIGVSKSGSPDDKETASPVLADSYTASSTSEYSNWLPPTPLNPLSAALLSPGAIFPLVASFLHSGSSWGTMRTFFYDAHSSSPRQRLSLARVYRHPFYVLVVLWAGAANMVRGYAGRPIQREDVSTLASLQTTAMRLKEAMESQLALEIARIRTDAAGYFRDAVGVAGGRQRRMDDEMGMDLLASISAMQLMLRTLLINFSFPSYIQGLYLTIEALFTCGILDVVGKGMIRSPKELAVRQEWFWLIRMLATQDLSVANWVRPSGTPARPPSFTLEMLESLPLPLEEGVFDPIQNLDGLEDLEAAEVEVSESSLSDLADGDAARLASSSPTTVDVNRTGSTGSDHTTSPGGTSLWTTSSKGSGTVVAPVSSTVAQIQHQPAATRFNIDATTLLNGGEIVRFILTTPNFGGRRFGRTPGSVDYSGVIFAINVVVVMTNKFTAACMAAGTSFLELAFVNATGIIPERWAADPAPLLRLVEGYKQILNAAYSVRAALSGPELDEIDEVSDVARFRQMEAEKYPFKRLPPGSVLIMHIILHVIQMVSKGGTFIGFGNAVADWTIAFGYFPEATPEMIAILADILKHAIIAGRYVASFMDVVLQNGPPSEAVINNGHDVSCVLLSALAWYRRAEGRSFGEGTEYSRGSILDLVRRCLQPVGVPTVESRRMKLVERLTIEESFGV